MGAGRHSILQAPREREVALLRGYDGTSMPSRRVTVAALATIFLVAAFGAYWAARRGAPYEEGQPTAQGGHDPRAPGLALRGDPQEAKGVPVLAGGHAQPVARSPGAPEGSVLQISVVGRVVDDRRFPVAGASVRFHGDGGAVTPASSGSDGRFRISVPASSLGAPSLEGALHVWVGEERAALVSVRVAARPGEPVDLGTLELQAASRLSVRVTEEGRPAPGASVSLWIAGGADQAVALLAEAGVDAEGRASFARLPPGWVNLYARTRDGAVGRGEVDIRMGSPVAPLEISVGPPRTIEVTVVGADETAAPIVGARIGCDMTIRTGEQSLTLLPYVPPPVLLPSGPDGRTRVTGLVPGETLWLSASAEGFRLETAEVPPEGREVRFTLARVQGIEFPLRPGQRPKLPEGTSLRVELLAEEGAIGSSVSARMRAGRIVVAGWQGAPGIAVAPSGEVAPLLEGGDESEGVGRETEFTAPRTLEVRFVDATGTAVPGVLAELWASRFDDMFRASLPRRADAEGRVRFASLPPWPFTVHGFLTAHDDWGIEFDGADVTEGDATKVIVVGGERTIVARVRVDGVASLPSGLSISVARAIQGSSEEDPALGVVVLRARPVDPTETEGTVLASGRGSRVARATFAWPEAGGSVSVDLSVAATPDIEVDVRAAPGASLFVRVERWDEEKGLWLDPLRWGPASLLGIEAPGVRRIELPNGRYRLRDWLSRVVSEPFEVTDRTTSLRARLDLTGLVTVRGRVVGPTGPPDDRAQVIIEGPGIDTATEYGPGLLARGGRFEARLPAGRAYELRVWHPVLRPAQEGGSARVDGPVDDVVLRLAEGPKVRLRILLPDGTPLSTEVAKDGSMFVRPTALPGDKGQWLEIEAGADGQVSVSGLPTGDADLWLDMDDAFAPLRMAPARIVEGTTDLGTVRLDAGSTILLRLPEVDGKITGLRGEARTEGMPTFSRTLIEMDKSGPHRIQGLAAGPWLVEIHWTDAKGEEHEFSKALTVDGRSTVAVDLPAK